MSTAIVRMTDDRLGEEVFRCRRRRRSAVHTDLVGSLGYLQLFLFPPLLAFFAVGGLVFLAADVLGIQGRNPTLAAGIVGLFITVTLAAYFHVFSTPGTPNLVLFENGFRYKRHGVPFSSLASIAVGRDESTLGQIAQVFGQFIQWHPAGKVVENSVEASVTLRFHDGSKTTLKNVLVENVWEDLDRFFAAIERNHPEISIATSRRPT